MQENLTVNVDITKADLFKEVLDMLKDIVSDKNISEDIRRKYKNRLDTMLSNEEHKNE